MNIELLRALAKRALGKAFPLPSVRKNICADRHDLVSGFFRTAIAQLQPIRYGG
jgi:hypothetical protein